jgi:hypothetical protein
VIRERKLLVVNGIRMIVDAPEIALTLAHGSDRVFGILDVGNFQVCWMISAASLTLQEVNNAPI